MLDNTSYDNLPAKRHVLSIRPKTAVPGASVYETTQRLLQDVESTTKPLEVWCGRKPAATRATADAPPRVRTWWECWSGSQSAHVSWSCSRRLYLMAIGTPGEPDAPSSGTGTKM